MFIPNQRDIEIPMVSIERTDNGEPANGCSKDVPKTLTSEYLIYVGRSMAFCGHDVA